MALPTCLSVGARAPGLSVSVAQGEEAAEEAREAEAEEMRSNKEDAGRKGRAGRQLAFHLAIQIPVSSEPSQVPPNHAASISPRPTWAMVDA